MSDNARGALLMVASMATFIVSDTFMKLLSDELPLFQAIFLRGLGVSFAFLLLAWRMGALCWPAPRDRRLIGWRVLAECAAAAFFLSALFNMPLANATAILQSLPLTMTVAGALILGEKVGVRRITAVVVGFGGVMLIVRPGAEGFNIYALVALAAVVAVTLRDIVTRLLSPEVPSVLVACVTSVGVTVFGGLAAIPTGWVPPSPGAVLLLAATSLTLIAAYLLSVMTIRAGEVSFVAPFRYTSLVWALLLGYLVWGDWPDALTLAGAAVVVAAGSFTLWRAGRKGSAAAVPPDIPRR